MSDPNATAGPALPKQDPQAFVLRGRPRPVVRVRRGLIVAVTGAAAAALLTLSWLALEPPGFRKAASAAGSDEPASRAGRDALADAPKTYGDVPRLGPPLPGDLGRPILEHERSIGTAPSEAPLDSERGRAAADEQRERIAAAKQAARTSPVIVELAEGTSKASARSSSSASEAPSGETPSPPYAAPAGEQLKMDFARSLSSGDLNPHTLVRAVSPWTLTAGTVIPASLVTGLNSDLPGMVIAQVTQNVRDSATGRTVLIPQGARLIGTYDSAVAFGQRRALLVWTRIVLPDGSSIRLDNMPATDMSGYAGVEDRVDSHTWALLRGAAISTLLGVGTQLSIGGSESDLARALRESTQQNAANAGDRIAMRNLDVQPTIRVRPGWPVRAIVNKDLVLQPWRG
jgi:type IV secretion system protein VirB10